MRPAFLEKDPEKKKEAYQKMMTETIIPHIALVEKHLVKNGTGCLVGNEVGFSKNLRILTIIEQYFLQQVTWADIAYYGYFSFVMEKFGDSITEGAPYLKTLIEKIGNTPNIKKWVDVRPVTEI